MSARLYWTLCGPNVLINTKNSKVGASERKFTDDPPVVVFFMSTQVSAEFIHAILESPYLEWPVKYGTLA
jgi:hypothetical protein